MRNLKSDISVLSIFTYTYDAAGNRTGVEEADGDLVTWSYDGARQLTREQRSGDDSYDITYTYDGAGNRKTEVEGGTTVTYVYDAANQLLVGERPTARVTYSWDANGNLALINNMGTRTTYTWDAENRVTQVEVKLGAVIDINTMVYDGDGKRRSYDDSAMVRTFLWDGENIARQTGRDYTYNPQVYGEIVSMQAGEGEQKASYFYHFDALGSTDRITDANGDVKNQYLYRAFGEQTDVIAEGISNRFTWVGKLGYYREPDLDTYWLRARVYDPQRGRFISRDPVTEEANLYRWPGNSPVVEVDPSGMQGCRGPECRERGRSEAGRAPMSSRAQAAGSLATGAGEGTGKGKGAIWGGGMGPPDAFSPGGSPDPYNQFRSHFEGDPFVIIGRDPCGLRLQYRERNPVGGPVINLKDYPPPDVGGPPYPPLICMLSMRGASIPREQLPPVCCPWLELYTFITAAEAKCRECQGICERELASHQFPVTRGEPAFLGSMMHCVFLCMVEPPWYRTIDGYVPVLQPGPVYRQAVADCRKGRRKQGS